MLEIRVSRRALAAPVSRCRRSRRGLAGSVALALIGSGCSIDSRRVEATEDGAEAASGDLGEGAGVAAGRDVGAAPDTPPSRDGLSSTATCVPSGPEVCDGMRRDEDCDGSVDEGCDCTSGQSATCGATLGARGACASRRVTCTNGQWPTAECAATSAEQCDAQFADEDCDGESNEAPPCGTLTTIEATQTHACGITTSGRVLCWGSNARGELGNGTREASSSPVEVFGVTGAQSLALGTGVSCAVLADRSARCWGRMPQNPFGSDDPSIGPARVSVFPEVLELAVDAFRLCAVLPDQTVSCTVEAGAGASPTSTPIAGLTGVRAIAQGSGSESFSAIVADGSVHRWRGADTVSVAVPGLANAVELGDGFMSCARLATGQVGCWGAGFALPPGQLSALVPGVDDAVALGTGQGQACVVRVGGIVTCWGSDLSSAVALDLGRADVAEVRVLTNESLIVRVESGGIYSALGIYLAGEFSAFTLYQYFIP